MKISYQRGWEHRLEHPFQVGLTFLLPGHLCKKLKSSVNHFTHQYNKGAYSYMLVLLCRLSELYLERTQNRVSTWKAHVSVVINTLLPPAASKPKTAAVNTANIAFLPADVISVDLRRLTMNCSHHKRNPRHNAQS